MSALSPATAIAVLCARERLDVDPDGTPAPRRLERLRARCTEVDDWDALIERSRALLVLPLVHRHLRAAAADVVPPDVLGRMGAVARRLVLRNLQLAQLHLRLSRDLLAPLGVPHVFLKGTTLAHRFYAEPNLRVARDVDVLVPAEALRAVALMLREQGFTPLHAGMEHDDAIRFASRVLGELAWVSPEGVLVEVHSRLSLGEGRLPTGRLLADPDQVQVAGVPLPTLGLDDTLAHLCLHHTRSGWTHLHCVADLDAVLRATGGDVPALVGAARAGGFGRIVAASFGLHRVLAAADPLAAQRSQAAAASDPAARLTAELAAVCLAGLTRTAPAPGLRPSGALRRRAGRAAVADLPAAVRRRVGLRLALQPLQRQSADYLRLPLAPRWHGAYLVLRPVLRLVRGGAQRAVASR